MEKLVNVSRAATPQEKAIAIESAADELTKIVREHRQAWLGIQQILKDASAPFTISAGNHPAGRT